VRPGDTALCYRKSELTGVFLTLIEQRGLRSAIRMDGARRTSEIQLCRERETCLRLVAAETRTEAMKREVYVYFKWMEQHKEGSSTGGTLEARSSRDAY
jgi:hypothetical protein